MGGARRHPRYLLSAAVRALGPRPERAVTGRADRFPEPALLLLLYRDLAAGDLLSHRPAYSGGDRPVPDERGRRPRLVRLSRPADGVDRSVLRDRTRGRGRPARAYAARWPQMDGGDLRPQGPQAFPLADGGVVDRRRLGSVFRRRADAGEGPRDRRGSIPRLCLDRHSHRHHLFARRPHARASVPVYVPVAASFRIRSRRSPSISRSTA